jgi:ubiquinone/menaquinone biosynthesis C-methylase UbiE
MNNAFDHIAEDYDRNFTDTVTGRLVRQLVLGYIDNQIIKGRHLQILELNCGTGEDAIHFFKNGNKVYATDISSEMIRVAKAKAGNSEGNGLTFSQLSFAQLPEEWMKEKFDLVFSNFGGLNCINEEEMARLFRVIKQILKPRGRFVGVIMPRYCLWEIIYFSLKGERKKAYRRKSPGPVSVNLDGTAVNTWYYSPSMIKKMASEYETIDIRPVGLFLPPSFLEGFFLTKKQLLKLLGIFEKIFNKLNIFAGVSDHFLFDLKK